MRRIAHLDMDAFYASCELIRYPQLKGQPVVIGGGRTAIFAALTRIQAEQPEVDWVADEQAGGPARLAALQHIRLDEFARLADYTGRGVITTATYAARQFGVGSAMGMMKAAKLCPQAFMLPVDFDEYRRYSRRFKTIIREIAPLMEDRGVDEVYIDFTDVPGGQREGGRVLARLIQKAIFEDTGLTCSVGVAPNKLLAKMASEFNKPNGISIVFEADVPSKIWPLACRKINGIGPKADEKLQAMGVRSIGELAVVSVDVLIDRFGQKTGAWLQRAAQGHDDRPVELGSEPVSISRETTFERDLHAVRDKAELGAIFTNLCQKLAGDLQRKGYVAKTIGIKLRFDDFKSVTRDISLGTATADPALIRRTAGLCLKRVDLSRKLRLIGVRVGALAKLVTSQSSEVNQAAEHIKPAHSATKNKADTLLSGQLF